MRFFITEYHSDDMFSFWVTKYYIVQLIMNVKCFQQSMVWYNLRMYLDFMEITSKLRISCKALRWGKPRLTQNIVTRANATNIKIILLKNAKTFNSHIWYDCGLDSINTRCYADITNLAKIISYIDALLGIYACTGCDYTLAFYQIGNVRQ